jgi:hypothetical protein
MVVGNEYSTVHYYRWWMLIVFGIALIRFRRLLPPNRDHFPSSFWPLLISAIGHGGRNVINSHELDILIGRSVRGELTGLDKVALEQLG